MAEGFRYASGFAPIRAVLLLLAVVSLMGTPYSVLLPVIAREVLGGGAGTLGALTAASGVGALVSALYLASRTSVVGLERVIVASAALFGVGLVGFSRAGVLWLAIPLMLVTGAGMMLQMASSMTMLQTIVDEDKRGRVMSLVAMSFFGTVPFGSLLRASLDPDGGPNTILVPAGWSASSAPRPSFAPCPSSGERCVPSTCGWGSCRRSQRGWKSTAQLTPPRRQ